MQISEETLRSFEEVDIQMRVVLQQRKPIFKLWCVEVDGAIASQLHKRLLSEGNRGLLEQPIMDAI